MELPLRLWHSLTLFLIMTGVRVGIRDSNKRISRHRGPDISALYVVRRFMLKKGFHIIQVGKFQRIKQSSFLSVLVVLVLYLASCGAVRRPDPPPSTCVGLHCATVYKRSDSTCVQVTGGENKRTYAAATQSNLTVYFFYLVTEYDGHGSVTATYHQNAILNGNQEVRTTCDYDFKNGTQYRYDLAKECATTRSGATLANCTSEEKNLRFYSTASSNGKVGRPSTGAVAVRSTSRMYDPVQLLKEGSSCSQICNLTTDACLRVPFTKEQTVDLDKATSILFGIGSKNALAGCRQSINVTPDSSKANQRSVSVTGSDNQCLIDIDSRAGRLELLITKGTTLKTVGNQGKFAMAPTTEDTTVVKLPIDDWQTKYGGRVLATEGTQANTVITTENGCIRLQRFH
jgi:hypothetical protein